MKTTAIDLTNYRFGSLTYIKSKGRKNKDTIWLCKCDCGEVCEVAVHDRRKRKSCSKTCPTRSKSARARKDGIWICEKHGAVRAAPAARGCFECSACKNTRNRLKSQKLKLKAVNFLGGYCTQCGYNKCISALEFHHRKPAEKDFNITSSNTRPWSKIEAELKKCELLCANCHREHHYNEG